MLSPERGECDGSQVSWWSSGMMFTRNVRDQGLIPCWGLELFPSETWIAFTFVRVNTRLEVPLYWNESESDIAFRYDHRDSNLMLTLNSNKDQTKFAFVFAQCNWTPTLKNYLTKSRNVSAIGLGNMAVTIKVQWLWFKLMGPLIILMDYRIFYWKESERI